MERVFRVVLNSIGCNISSDLEAAKRDVELLDLLVALGSSRMKISG